MGRGVGVGCEMWSVNSISLKSMRKMGREERLNEKLKILVRSQRSDALRWLYYYFMYVLIWIVSSSLHEVSASTLKTTGPTKSSIQSRCSRLRLWI